ncbi:MAG: DUF1707 SHOCT-like domain-containing protein [Streptosporangiaceae bacterium]
MTIDDPGGPSRLRISDADRDTIAGVLGDALAEGRLGSDEHSERLGAVYEARTAADLAPLVADLPGADRVLAAIAGGPARPLPDRAAGPDDRTSWLVSIFSGTDKRGAWVVPRHVTSVNVFGGTELDLREAVLPGRVVSLRVICVFGGASITVPPEMVVADSGIALFGGRSTPSDAADGPDAPVLHVHSICVFGGVDISRRPRTGEDRADRGSGLDAPLPAIRIRRSDLRREIRSERRTARRSARRRWSS